MGKKEKRTLILSILGIGAVVLIFTNLKLVSDCFHYIMNLLMPVIIGIILAFVINVPVSSFEKLFSGMSKKKNGTKKARKKDRKKAQYVRQVKNTDAVHTAAQTENTAAESIEDTQADPITKPVTAGTGIKAAYAASKTENKSKIRIKIQEEKKKHNKKNAIHALSILLTIICLSCIITLFYTLVVPSLIEAGKSIIEMIQDSWPGWMEKLEEHNIDTSKIEEWFKNIFEDSSMTAGNLIGFIADITTSTISVVLSILVGTIIAIYILFSRDTLIRQSKKVLFAYCKEKTAKKTCYIFDLIQKAYTKFFTGQCIEALILGVLMSIALSIFRIPYAGVIGLMTTICAMIPYVGAFISCALGGLLILLASPHKIIIYFIIYLVIQFVETELIYPHVVGGSVGLSPLWTLIAVIIGGKIFGLIGTIFFIPMVSVFYTLIKRNVNEKLEKKKESKEQKE